jgi:GWxTD domain-containing protein
VAAATFCLVASPVRALSQQGATPPRLIVRPIQPRWISPDSTLPQPVSLEWLDGDEWAFEVQSILTSEEMREYAELRRPQERDAFIERFWARRDPSPGTPPNEFRDEFIRRVEFARERLADPKSAATLGFDTDRGRVYLMFGPPDSIESRAAGTDRIDEWRYKDVAAIGGDFSVRFSSARGMYCGYRIVSPAPIATVGGAGAEHAPALQFYPLGLVAISIPVEAARVTGAHWELRNRHGVQVDDGTIGFMEGPVSDPLSRHLSPSWLEMGIGCTHALPADTYTLTTAVRFVSGRLQNETVTFTVQ